MNLGAHGGREAIKQTWKRRKFRQHRVMSNIPRKEEREKRRQGLVTFNFHCKTHGSVTFGGFTSYADANTL